MTHPILGTILLVDDDHFVLDSVRQLLEALGYHVVEASNGLEALQRIDQHGANIDVVMTDVNMPVMDGLELATKLRAKLPCVSVLFVSGCPQETSGSGRLLPAGANFLPKPFSLSELETMLREILGG